MSYNNMNNDNFNANGNTLDKVDGNVFINSPQQKNSINKTVVYKEIKYPNRQSKKEREKEQKKTQRPGLRDRYKQPITCFGTVVCPYPNSDLYTVVNIVGSHGNYMADHIQLNFKEDLYDYKGQNPLLDKYIRFTGLVDKYPKNGGYEYCVNITDKVDIRSSKIYYDKEPVKFNPEEIDIDSISTFLNKSNITKLYDLVDYLRCEIDIIVEDILPIDYIPFYIYNQYFLNTTTYNLYEGNFRDQGFREGCVLDIILLLSYTLFELQSNYSYDLFNLFENICYACNIIQGIEKLTIYNIDNKMDATYDMNPEFIEFCRTRLGYEGKHKLKSLWYVAKLRKMDFQMENPKCDYIDKQILTNKAYYIINKYINKDK